AAAQPRTRSRLQHEAIAQVPDLPAHPEELAYPSVANKESPSVHVYAGSTKLRRHLNLGT
ncbi:hypothetical protein GW17_00052176, partial [Ensete ventricosum]